MENEKVFAMKFSKVYPLLRQKAQRKGRAAQEVDEAACWLTGYTQEDLDRLLTTDITCGAFFEQAPAWHPNAGLITGTVCGVRVEAVPHPLMRRIRQLDKLVDEIAKGKPMDKVLR